MSTGTTFLSLEALAASLGAPRDWLRDLADRHEIPVISTGSRRLFDLASVHAALVERSRVQLSSERRSPSALNAAAPEVEA